MNLFKLRNLLGLSWLCGAVWASHAAEQTIFYLRNGDRVTGAVLAEDPQTVTLSSTALGKVVIPVPEIERRERLRSEDQAAASTNGLALVSVSQISSNPPALTPPTALTASQQRRLSELMARYREDKITPAEYQRQRAQILSEPEAPQLAAQPAPARPEPQQLAQTAAPPPAKASPPAAAAPGGTTGTEAAPGTFLERVRKHTRGSVQVGMDLGFGTKEHQLYTGRLLLNYAEKRVRNALDYRVAYGHTDEVLSANEMEGSIKTDFDLAKARRFYAYNAAGAGFNEVRKIDLTYHEGLGLGYKLLTRSNLVANLESGAQYQAYEYANRPSREAVSIRFGQEATWRITQKLLLTQKAQVTPSVEDLADYRLRFEARLSYPLFKNLSLNLNVIDQYDSQPAPGVEPNDLQVQSTIGFTF
jgi:hypothetical protein